MKPAPHSRFDVRRIEMDYEKIIFDKEMISRITLNDPDKRNALSKQMCTELWDAMKKVERDPDCRVVIIDAVGPVFSAGHDISEEIPIGSPEPTEESWREFLEYLRHEWYLKWWDYTKPILCKVDGTAIAGGIEMSCFADACACSEESFFTYWPISTVSTAFSPSLILPWIIGMRKAKELLLSTGWTGKQAEQFGLVNNCFPREELEDKVMLAATVVTKIIPETMRLGKFAFRFIYDRMGLRDAITLGSEMDILAHCQAADKPFQETMRTTGVPGIIEMCKENMKGINY